MDGCDLLHTVVLGCEGELRWLKVGDNKEVEKQTGRGLEGSRTGNAGKVELIALV